MTPKPHKAGQHFLFLVWCLASSSSRHCRSSCLSPQMDQLLGSVIEMWVDRMDNITQPERRKLSSLALLSLLPSDNRCNTLSSSSHFHVLSPSAIASLKIFQKFASKKQLTNKTRINPKVSSDAPQGKRRLILCVWPLFRTVLQLQ